MTVQEALTLLNKIEDKSKELVAASYIEGDKIQVFEILDLSEVTAEGNEEFTMFVLTPQEDEE